LVHEKETYQRWRGDSREDPGTLISKGHAIRRDKTDSGREGMVKEKPLRGIPLGGSVFSLVGVI
jgi:hypothetical protein